MNDDALDYSYWFTDKEEGYEVKPQCMELGNYVDTEDMTLVQIKYRSFLDIIDKNDFRIRV